MFRFYNHIKSRWNMCKLVKVFWNSFRDGRYQNFQIKLMGFWFPISKSRPYHYDSRKLAVL